MIRLSEGTQFTPELVKKIVSNFKSDSLPRFQQLQEYFDAEHLILKRSREKDQSNNKLVNNFCKYITNVATGYFMGSPVKFTCDDQEYLNRLNEVLDDNFSDDTSYEVAKQASIKGEGYELLYTNEQSKVKFKWRPPEEIIPIFGYEISSYIIAAIRIYTETNILDDTKTDVAVVYTDTEIITYKKASDQENYAEIERAPHYFGEVPIVEYINNQERKGDFEEIISLNDEYNKGQSDTANDFEEFTDAYLTLVGFGSTDNADIKKMKEERVLLLNEAGQASWLIKTINDTALENFKKRLSKDIHKFSQVPDLSDESFAGNLSGVAIKYKLWGLEQLAGTKERKFETALIKRAEMITRLLNLTGNKKYDPNTLKVIFNRNIPQNELEIVNMVRGLSGIISKRTQLDILPVIEDSEAELKRIEDEAKEAPDDYSDTFRKEETKTQSQTEVNTDGQQRQEA